MGLLFVAAGTANPSDVIGWTIAAIVLVVLLIILSFVPVGLWIKARDAGAKVDMIDLIGMRMRRTPPAKIVLPYIKAAQAGLDLDVKKLEGFYLAGGNVERVVEAMI
ncbi:MAG: flotillin-like FloA family protein, partial [Clostridiales bacterium]|nr:flotillin-like FloA family protein [Clostridiales bacterium]